MFITFNSESFPIRMVNGNKFTFSNDAIDNDKSDST